jgi:hypothetical protein
MCPTGVKPGGLTILFPTCRFDLLDALCDDVEQDGSPPWRDPLTRAGDLSTCDCCTCRRMARLPRQEKRAMNVRPVVGDVKAYGSRLLSSPAGPATAVDDGSG